MPNRHTDNDNQLSDLTLEYLKTASLSHRKAQGQYFTPRSVREYLLRQLPQFERGAKIIDPASGTGEFLHTAAQMFPAAKLFGIELDKAPAKVSEQLVPTANIRCQDALFLNEKGQYDAVIGNPPYFEFKPSSELLAEYGDILTGRPNIFGMFIKLGLELLKPNGYLGFVIPPSMNNGAYFSALRDFIKEHADIKHLSILSSEKIFIDAQQTVMVLILQKRKNTGKYVFERNGITIFSQKADFLKKAFEGVYSLHDLGYQVKTGTVVWNQHKDKLTDCGDSATPLLWAHNIKGGQLTFPASKEGKPQYVQISRHETGPAIIVNRITGAAEKVQIRTALIPSGMKFVGENHVNVVTRSKKEALFNNGYPDVSLEEINRQLCSAASVEVMRAITGNTQVSKTELEYLIPIRVPGWNRPCENAPAKLALV